MEDGLWHCCTNISPKETIKPMAPRAEASHCPSHDRSPHRRRGFCGSHWKKGWTLHEKIQRIFPCNSIYTCACRDRNTSTFEDHSHWKICACMYAYVHRATSASKLSSLDRWLSPHQPSTARICSSLTDKHLALHVIHFGHLILEGVGWNVTKHVY